MPKKTNITFQSTLPVWGATRGTTANPCGYEISIHAPRMGSDLRGFDGLAPRLEISIHAPRMGSDAVVYPLVAKLFISIHAPRMGSDSSDSRSARP